MNIEKLPSGNYRITQMYKRKRYRFTLDHKPTQKESTMILAEMMQDTQKAPTNTISKCIDEYIEIRSNTVSPVTIRTYKALKRNCPEWFLNCNLYDISQIEIQKVINEYSINHAPKTTRNFHGFIASVLGLFRPNMAIKTTLPQIVRDEIQLPSKDDIRRLLDALKGTEYYIPVYLGCLGLRRSEIIALSVDDFQGNKLIINKASVPDVDGNFVIKATKTTDSSRIIYVPTELTKAVKKKGCVFKGYPNSIARAMHNYQDKIGMPRCRFHDLRHFYASYAHSVGMSDADIMKAGGWKTDNVMKRVYRHSMNDESEQKRVVDSMFNDFINNSADLSSQNSEGIVDKRKTDR